MKIVVRRRVIGHIAYWFLTRVFGVGDLSRIKMMFMTYVNKSLIGKAIVR